MQGRNGTRRLKLFTFWDETGTPRCFRSVGFRLGFSQFAEQRARRGRNPFSQKRLFFSVSIDKNGRVRVSIVDFERVDGPRVGD